MIDMSEEELEQLHSEDFMAPNAILCYGAGGAFSGVAPYLQKCSINIIAVIDEKRRGKIAVGGKEIPIISIDEAALRFKDISKVIITIANRRIALEVEKTLIAKGFKGQNIFDINVWSWLTIPSSKCNCQWINEYIHFFPNGMAKCCNPGVIDAYICEWYMEGQELKDTAYNFVEKWKYYISERREGRIPLYCNGCPFLTDEICLEKPQIATIITGDHDLCNSDCVYCDYGCSIPRKPIPFSLEQRIAAMVSTLRKLCSEMKIADNVKIQIASGEISINPYRGMMFDFLKSHPTFEVQILSNCFVFDKEIAEVLAINKEHSYLLCDLDAGTKETYTLVKGFNRYEDVIHNLKLYQEHGCNVKIKYLILPGWNDSDDDYEGAIQLLQDLKLKEMALSPESKISREGGRYEIRKILFSSARFALKMKENGIKAIFPHGFWKKEHISEVRRFIRELER